MPSYFKIIRCTTKLQSGQKCVQLNSYCDNVKPQNDCDLELWGRDVVLGCVTLSWSGWHLRQVILKSLDVWQSYSPDTHTHTDEKDGAILICLPSGARKYYLIKFVQYKIVFKGQGHTIILKFHIVAIRVYVTHFCPDCNFVMHRMILNPIQKLYQYI
jgi:hypothetical protein